MKRAICAAIIIASVFTFTGCKSSDYKKAQDYLWDEKYDAAVEIFSSLGDYKDSLEKVNEAKYKKAEKLIDSEKLEEALNIFLELGDYRDASDRVNEVTEMMKIHATSITLSKDSVFISKGETYNLDIMLEPENTTDTIQAYISSDENVATVSANGEISAVGYGQAVITIVTSNSLSATCNVTVPEPVKPNISSQSSESSSNTSDYSNFSMSDYYSMARDTFSRAKQKSTIVGVNPTPVKCTVFQPGKGRIVIQLRMKSSTGLKTVVLGFYGSDKNFINKIGPFSENDMPSTLNDTDAAYSLDVSQIY